MKLALVYDRKENLVKREGEPLAFLVFKPWWLVKNWYGWSVHILTFLNAIAEDFSRYSYQGVLAFGREYGEWFIAFTPNTTTHKLSLKRDRREV